MNATSDHIETRHGVKWAGDPEGVRHLLSVIDADPDGLPISDLVAGCLEALVLPLDEDSWAVVWFVGDTEISETYLSPRGWETDTESVPLSEVAADVSDAAVGVAAEVILARYCLAGDPVGLCQLVDDLGCSLSDVF